MASTIFCSMLDAAGINSMILLTLNMRESEETPQLRRKFLLELGHQLIKPLFKQCYNNPNSRRGLIETIRGILKINEEPPTPSTSSTSPSMSSSSNASLQENLSIRCYICLEENCHRYKIGTCDLCNHPFCKQHQAKRCEHCARITHSKERVNYSYPNVQNNLF